jgi:hypothetical protein
MEQLDVALKKAGVEVEGEVLPAMELARLEEDEIVSQVSSKPPDLSRKN